MTHQEFVNKLLLLDLIDEREAVVFCRGDGPAGNGLCLACVKGNTLRMLESDYTMRIGQVHETVALKDVENLKCSAFVLHSYLKFRYRGQRYLLKDFGGAKQFIAVVREEAARA